MNVQETIMQWDTTFPRRFLIEREGADPRFVERLEEEYKRFQALRALYPNRDFPVSEPVDKFWHAHVLCTRDYEEMGNAVGHPLHHTPLLDEEERIIVGREYPMTLSLYQKHFGEPPADLWPPNQYICTSKGPGK